MHRAWVARGCAVSSVGVLLLLVSSGCASHQQKLKYDVEMRKISVDTQPTGAKVYQIGSMDGSRTFLGTTPIKAQSVVVTTGASFKRISPAQMQNIVSHVEMVQIVVEKPGYQTYQGNLSTKREGKVADHTIKLEPAAQATAR
jgi:hypothetical protein